MRLRQRLGVSGFALLMAGPALGATVSHTEPRSVSAQEMPSLATNAHLASTATGSLVTYVDSGGIGARLLDAGGEPLGHPFYLEPRQPRSFIDWPVGMNRPVVAFDGTSYVAAWTESVEDNPPILFRGFDSDGQRTFQGGSVLPNPIGDFAIILNYLGLSLTPSPTGTLLMACTNDQASKASCQTWRIATGGGVTVAGAVAIPFDTESVRLASLGTTSVAVLEAHGVLSLLRLDETGAFLDDAPLALGTGSAVAAVGIGGGFTAIWADGANVRRAAIDALGAVTAATEPLLKDVTLAAPPTCIVTPNGPALLAREQSGDVVLRFFSATWELLGTPLLLGVGNSKGALDLSLTTDASTLVAVWTAADGTVVSRALDLSDLDAAPPPTPLSRGTFDQETPFSLRVGTKRVVFWSEAGAIRSVEVDPQGELTAYIKTLSLPTGPYSQAQVLGVTGDSLNGRVVWQKGQYISIADALDNAPAFSQLLPIQGQVRVTNHDYHWFAAFIDHSDEHYVVSVRSDAGDTVQIASLLALPPGASSVPFDLVALEGGYRVWWADEQGHVRAKDVRGASLSDGPDFLAPAQAPTFLSATATSVLAGNDSGAFFKSNRAPWTATLGSTFSALVDVLGSSAVVRHVPGDQTDALELELAAPGGQFEVLDVLAGGEESSLSEPLDDKMLLSFTRLQSGVSAPVSRVYTSIITVADVAETGVAGAGGGGSVGGDEAGTPSEGAAAGQAGGDGNDEPSVGGAASNAGGAESAGTDNAGGIATSAGGVTAAGGVRHPSASGGCDCRLARPAEETHLAGLLVTLAAVVLRRRRRAACGVEDRA